MKPKYETYGGNPMFAEAYEYYAEYVTDPETGDKSIVTAMENLGARQLDVIPDDCVDYVFAELQKYHNTDHYTWSYIRANLNQYWLPVVNQGYRRFILATK